MGTKPDVDGRLAVGRPLESSAEPAGQLGIIGLPGTLAEMELADVEIPPTEAQLRRAGGQTLGPRDGGIGNPTATDGTAEDLIDPAPLFRDSLLLVAIEDDPSPGLTGAARFKQTRPFVIAVISPTYTPRFLA